MVTLQHFSQILQIQHHLVQYHKQQLSFEWSLIRISTTDSIVRNSLRSIINSTTGNFFSLTTWFIFWLHFHWDEIIVHVYLLQLLPALPWQNLSCTLLYWSMVVSLQVVSLHDKVDSLQSCRVFLLTLLVITRLYFILNFSKLFNTKSWLQRIDFMMQRNDFIMLQNDLQRNDFVAKRPFLIFLFRNKDSSPLKVLFKGVH